MFKDSFEGQTHSCPHETYNPSGICDECLGEPRYEDVHKCIMIEIGGVGKMKHYSEYKDGREVVTGMEEIKIYQCSVCKKVELK